MSSNIRNRIESAGTIKTLCELAETHSSRDEKPEPGAEHFVLAAIDLPDGTAKLAFANAGSVATSFKWAIQRQYEDALLDLGLDPHTLARESVQDEAVDKCIRVYSASPSGRELMQALASNSKSHDRPDHNHAVRSSDHG